MSKELYRDKKLGIITKTGIALALTGLIPFGYGIYEVSIIGKDIDELEKQGNITEEIRDEIEAKNKQVAINAGILNAGLITLIAGNVMILTGDENVDSKKTLDNSSRI